MLIHFKVKLMFKKDVLKESYCGDACPVTSPNTVKTRLPYDLSHMTWQKIQEDWISSFEAQEISPSIFLYLSKAYVLH